MFIEDHRFILYRIKYPRPYMRHLRLRWLPGAIYGWLHIAIPDALTKRRHPQAVLNSAAAFLDSAAYLSISVSIAGIVFDKKSNPLLYDDKLGQASTLLAINAPVAILLLTFKALERRKTRYLLVLVDVLLTLAIQFPFKKAKSFDPSLSACLGWKENDLRDKFQHLYIVIGVWGIFVALFFIYQSVAWLAHRFYKSTPVTALSNPSGQGSRLAAPSQAQSRGGASRSIDDARDPPQHPTTRTSRLVRCTHHVDIQHSSLVRNHRNWISDIWCGELIASSPFYWAFTRCREGYCNPLSRQPMGLWTDPCTVYLGACHCGVHPRLGRCLLEERGRSGPGKGERRLGDLGLDCGCA